MEVGERRVRDASVSAARARRGAATAAATMAALAPGAGADLRTAVLVEGTSDQAALAALARRRGQDLDADGVVIVAMGGVGNITHFLELLGPRGLGVGLAGLYDVAEEGVVRRGLECAGLGTDRGRAGMEAAGFCVCVADLEDELIRALGTELVEAVVEAAGELRPLRTFQKQPAQRDRSTAEQLRRFMGTHSGRKIRYGALLVDALDLTRTPPPLERLLECL